MVSLIRLFFGLQNDLRFWLHSFVVENEVRSMVEVYMLDLSANILPRSSKGVFVVVYCERCFLA
jgi:hypothetical protein